MLFEQQITERRERGRSAIARILSKPQGRPFGGTNRPVLAIPLPDSVGQERLVAALSGLLAGLAGGRHE